MSWQWFVLETQLKDGSRIDLLSGNPVSFAPTARAALIRNQPFFYYSHQILNPENGFLIPDLKRWIGRLREEHPEVDQEIPTTVWLVEHPMSGFGSGQVRDESTSQTVLFKLS